MRVSVVSAVAVGSLASAAIASPLINGAVINERIFNDFPTSTVTSVNNYASLISISDQNVDAASGFANLHNWRASADGGATEADFRNQDGWSMFADVTIDGTGGGEGGLNLSPWWSQEVDGRFNMRTTDGEVAVFGGRLPFYSFSASQGVVYTKGDTIRLGMVYDPHSLSMADPATIEYTYDDGVTVYTSGPLAFDQGNPAENPPYGLWGQLNDARIGGFMQVFGNSGSPTGLTTTWENIAYTAIPAPGSLALLGIGALGTRRRR